MKFMNIFLHEFAHGKKCCKCGAEATDIRIEYSGSPHASNEEREVMLEELFLDLVDEETLKIQQTNKITPYCYPCHKKYSSDDEGNNYVGEYVSYLGYGNSGLGV